MLQRAAGVPDQLSRADFEQLQLQRLGFDFRKIQDLVDDVEQVVGRVPCQRQVFLLRRSVLGVHGQLGHAHNAVHGGANFMAHVRQEFTTHAVVLFGLFLGLDQHSLGVFDGRKILHHPHKMHLIVHPHLADGQAQREQLAILASTMEHTRLVDDLLFTRALVGQHVIVMSLPIFGAHQPVNFLANELLGGVAKNGLCGGIALDDQAMGVGHHNGLWHRLENAVQLAFTQTHLPLNLLALVDFFAQLLDRGTPLGGQFARCEQRLAESPHRQPHQEQAQKEQGQKDHKGAVEDARAGDLPLRDRQHHLQCAAHISGFPIGSR